MGLLNSKPKNYLLVDFHQSGNIFKKLRRIEWLWMKWENEYYLNQYTHVSVTSNYSDSKDGKSSIVFEHNHYHLPAYCVYLVSKHSQDPHPATGDQNTNHFDNLINIYHHNTNHDRMKFLALKEGQAIATAMNKPLLVNPHIEMPQKDKFDIVQGAIDGPSLNDAISLISQKKRDLIKTFLPMGFGVIFLYFMDLPARAVSLFIALWVLTTLFLVVRMYYIKCPSCHNLFFVKKVLCNFLTNECTHCGTTLHRRHQ
jgi:hypothetical protein